MTTFNEFTDAVALIPNKGAENRKYLQEQKQERPARPAKPQEILILARRINNKFHRI